MHIELDYYGEPNPPIKVQFENDGDDIIVEKVIYNGYDITNDPSTDLFDISFEVAMVLRVRKAEAQEALIEYQGEQMFEENRGN